MITWLRKLLPSRRSESDVLHGRHGRTATRIYVDEQNALSLSYVWAAVRAWADTLSSLPLVTYSPDGRPNRLHPNYQVLNYQPYPNGSRVSLMQLVAHDLMLWGNFYGEIEVSNGGRLRHLHRIPPWEVRVECKDDRLLYHVRGNDRPLKPEYVVHVKLFSRNSYEGYSPIGTLRETLGFYAAVDGFGQKWFGNAPKPGGILEHPQKLNPKAKEQLYKDVEERTRGDNDNNFLILSEGIQYKGFQIPLADANFVQLKQWNVNDAARCFKVPAYLIEGEPTTFSNPEQEGQNFVRHYVRPLVVNIEQELNNKLFAGDPHYCRFNLDSLLRGDTLTRYSCHNIGRNGGWLSVNDIRRIEDMPPIEGGDTYLQPLNMQPVNPSQAPSSLSQALDSPASDAGESGKSNGESGGEAGNGEVSSQAAADTNSLPIEAQREATKLTIIDAYGRMVRREQTALRRLAKKPDGFLQSVERFYNLHEQRLNQALLPSLQAYYFDAQGIAAIRSAEISRRVCTMRKQDILELAGEVTAEQLEERVNRLASRWDAREVLQWL